MEVGETRSRSSCRMSVPRAQSSDSGFCLHLALWVLILAILSWIMLPPSSRADRTRGASEPIVTASYIWHDSNGNGLQDPGEPPMAGVRVFVYAYGQDEAIGSAWSDAQGRCRLQVQGVPGRYWLRFEPPPGYAFTQPGRGGLHVRGSKAGPNGATAPFFNQGVVRHVDAGLVSQTEVTSGRDAILAFQ